MIDTKEVWRKINSTDPMDHIDLHATIMTLLSSLLNRLEVAESDCLEQARLNGMGGEREAALMAKLEAAEKERDALRAKIATMERQEPYAFAVVFPESSRVELVHDLDDLCEDMTNEAHEVRKLYLTSFQSQKENEND